jgi:hypothetical protein
VEALMAADITVSKPPPLPPPDDGKGRPPAGKRGPVRRKPPAKPAGKPGSAPAAGDGSAPEHRLDLLV